MAGEEALHASPRLRPGFRADHSAPMIRVSSASVCDGKGGWPVISAGKMNTESRSFSDTVEPVRHQLDAWRQHRSRSLISGVAEANGCG
jgi:hypothetical protein